MIDKRRVAVIVTLDLTPRIQANAECRAEHADVYTALEFAAAEGLPFEDHLTKPEPRRLPVRQWRLGDVSA